VKDKSSGGYVWLDTGSHADVQEGDVLDVYALAAGQSHLKSKTYVNIYNQAGRLIEVVKFETSCDQPLRIGDKFGSVQIVGLETTDSDGGSSSADVEYTYTITNTGSTPLTNVVVHDDTFGDELDCGPFAVLNPGQTVECSLIVELSAATTSTVTVYTAADPSTICATDTVVITAPEPEPYCGDGFVGPGEECDPPDGVTCDYSCQIIEIGGEGCTPGYWKKCEHFDSWPSQYSPYTKFNQVFDNAFSNKKLHEVAGLGGGGLNALGRATVAALLNAASPEVNYDLTVQEVIQMFNDVYPGSSSSYEQLKNLFEQYNEQSCPLH
jgi:hypothetical protein